MQSLKLNTEHQRGTGRRGGPSCAWKCSWGGRESKAGRGRNRRRHERGIQQLGGIFWSRRLLEELWEAAAEQGELREQGLPLQAGSWDSGPVLTLLHMG